MRFKIEKFRIDEGFLLETDSWDDWFEFSTMYCLKYIDKTNKTTEIGNIKIGQTNMESGQRRADIPRHFDRLDAIFFSVGQSVEYYENLKNLGDNLREEVLTSLNDMAFNIALFEKHKNQRVTQISLMRDISEKEITNQFTRVANGGAKLTNFSFGYSFPTLIKTNEKTLVVNNPAKITFRVKPESNPPTNIHIIIGRNGVGKTYFIKNLIKVITSNNDAENGFFFDPRNNEKLPASNLFANVICVGFSAFDDFPSAIFSQVKSMIFIGLNNEKSAASRVNELSIQFSNSLFKILSSKSKSKLWQNAMGILNYDNYFEESLISKIVFNEDQTKFSKETCDIFTRLSSGHKIILLIITQLVEVIEEKSLIIIDEPETHLHPPLLSAFTRALSDILTEKNAVSILATHSPIILQEVPSSCVWKMQRSKYFISLENLQQETFGTNINALNREVFGLEVEKSGFHHLLKEVLKKEDYDLETVFDVFNNELGDEAKALLRILVALKEKETE
ncbi:MULTISPECIES: AAA family ATPase [unclassified Acetobacterium]|jgi:predicted ATPase|uniref:AAA family ATPase n=1 Tax=unclassified Acetobacterium TaxID=2638182 RepID=UPI000DBECC4E|nr:MULTISPECIES: AAA family ATPase [unclassified Acetobacterium]AWW28347.1 ATP-binding protein [Acetobacterium sp. KB-1]MDZ5726840.1 AAA family ATPase [Acetobacterium sp. K1/6]